MPDPRQRSEQIARELSYESYICIKSHGDECQCAEKKITSALTQVERDAWTEAAMMAQFWSVEQGAVALVEEFRRLATQERS